MAAKKQNPTSRFAHDKHRHRPPNPKNKKLANVRGVLCIFFMGRFIVPESLDSKKGGPQNNFGHG